MVGPRPSAVGPSSTMLPGPVKIVCDVLRITTQSGRIFEIAISIVLCECTLNQKRLNLVCKYSCLVHIFVTFLTYKTFHLFPYIQINVMSIAAY